MREHQMRKKLFAVSAFSALSQVYFLLVAAPVVAKPPDMVLKMKCSEPSNVVTLLQNLKSVLDNGALSDPEISSDGTLRACFGLRGVNRADVDNDVSTVIRANDFGPIFPESEVRYAQFVMKVTNGPSKQTVALTLMMPPGIAPFNLVEKTFGSQWTRIPPTPNPHITPPIATAPLGNEDISFSFISAGRRNELVIGLFPDASARSISVNAEKE